MTTALQLAIACRDAYNPDYRATIVGNQLCQATVTRDRGIITVAFQGTNHRRDWYSNFDFTLVPHGPGRVSRGFLSSYKAVENHLLMEAIPNDDQIVVTGHSRGAPHACLLASKLAQMGIPPASVITFASPRWCDKAYAKFFASLVGDSHRRLVFESDLVTRMPPNVLGHCHTDNLRWFDGSQWRKNMPIWTRLGVYLFNRKWPFIGNNVADHDITEYITALQEHPLCAAPPSSSPSLLPHSPSSSLAS